MTASMGDFVLDITHKCYLSAASIIYMNNSFAFSQSKGG